MQDHANPYTPPMLMLAPVIALMFATPAPSAGQSAAALMAADSAFSAASAEHGLRSALETFLAADAIVPLPGGRFARGPAARDALDRAPFSGATVTWSPVRAGVSADGTHGFTFGYMRVTRGDSTLHAKYMTYWERQAGEWRIRAHKRAPCQAAAVNTATMPPSVPEAGARESDAEQRAQDRASLAAAESAFSDEAQRIGLGAAFARFGRPDAVNMGAPDRAFVVGAAAIGEAVGAGSPTDSSPVTWAADYDVLVSPAGDLGITFGTIHRNGAESGAPGFAFFTIWRRADRSAPWRYIAE